MRAEEAGQQIKHVKHCFTFFTPIKLPCKKIKRSKILTMNKLYFTMLRVARTNMTWLFERVLPLDYV